MSDPVRSDKQRMLEILEGQPDDRSFDELMRELAFERMVERGLADADAERTLDHQEMGRRISAWER